MEELQGFGFHYLAIFFEGVLTPNPTSCPVGDADDEGRALDEA